MVSRFTKIIFVLALSQAYGLYARDIVSPETIKIQKEKTQQFKLAGGIPVTYRQVDQSAIFLMSLGFDWGVSQFSKEDQADLPLMSTLMEKGSREYPKEKLYGILEKYSTGINCNFGIEMGSCSLMTLDAYAPELVPVLANIVKEPLFDDSEAKIELERAKSDLLASTQNPEVYVNEVVNGLFYGHDHPYWISKEESLKFLSKVKLDAVKGLYSRILQSSPKQITVVSGMPLDKVKELLEKYFVGIPAPNLELNKVSSPKYDPNNSFAFAERDIPTAYVRAKFQVPGVNDPDSPATQLMLHILSENLYTEIRTKRSLSYSVYADVIPYQMGIGVIHASTSKPTEVLATMELVLKDLKKKKLTVEELQRFKNVFATSYFLKLEEQSSLGGSIASAVHYRGNTDWLYDFPKRIEELTPEDVQRTANEYLRKFRLAVVYRKQGFDKKTAVSFLKAFP